MTRPAGAVSTKSTGRSGKARQSRRAARVVPRNRITTHTSRPSFAPHLQDRATDIRTIQKTHHCHVSVSVMMTYTHALNHRPSGHHPLR